MRQYLNLVRLFWQQLVRRRSLWALVALAGLVLLINTQIFSQVEELVASGVRYDVATHRAAEALDSAASQIQEGLVMLALIVGSLMAPGSRKDGTTQFVLTLSVSRLRLALAQFGALAMFIFLGTAVVHVGYVVAAQRLGVLQIPEALFAWIFLLVPLLLL